MKIECAYDELRAVGDLREHPRNPNTHPARQVELLAKIIRETGWRSPIVVSARSGFVVKGHGRLMAARLAGFAEAPVDVQEYESEAQELADMVADNRIAELAEMDGGLLDQVLVDLREVEGFDMDLTGYENLDEPSTTEPPHIKPLVLAPPPAMTWCLIGIPTNRMHEIQGFIEEISGNENTTIEMGVSS
jgi:hypothetical protein